MVKGWQMETKPFIFDIRKHADIEEGINHILNNGGIAEIKLERKNIPTLVEIKRTKKIPPRAE